MGHGVAEFKLNLHYALRVQVAANFLFKWQWKNLQGTYEGVHLKVTLDLSWEVAALVEATFQLKNKPLFDYTLFNRGFRHVFSIGPVPVVIKPYVKLGFTGKPKPIKV